MKKILLFIATGLFALVSCKPEKAPYLNLSKAEIAVPAESGTEKFVVEVESSSSWEAKTPVADTWVKLTTTDKTIELQFDNNEDVHPRVSSVTVTSHGETKEVKITQMAAKFHSELPSGSKISFDYRASEKSFEIVTDNLEWTAESDAEWCVVTPVPEEKKLKISVPTYNEDAERTANVKIKIGDEVFATYEISQQGKTFAAFNVAIPAADDMKKTSYVYDVKVNNKKVAEICLEYFHVMTSETQSIKKAVRVAYPYVDGRIDLSKGFCIEDGQPVSWKYDNLKAVTVIYEANSSVSGISKLYYADGGFTTYTDVETELIGEAEVSALYVSETQANKYPITKIGVYYWTAKNFVGTKFANGDDISSGSLDDWKDATTPLVYVPEDSRFTEIYGAYYNAAVASDNRSLLNDDWRIPTKDDIYNTIKGYTGLYSSYYRDEESDYTVPSGATSVEKENLTGFSAFPGGRYSFTSETFELQSHGLSAFFWASTVVTEYDRLTKNNITKQSYYTVSNKGMSYTAYATSLSSGYNIRLCKLIVPAATESSTERAARAAHIRM